MGEGAKWFRVAIGRQKNAEARWLLPMICRRGGIEKADIGAIKIYDGNSEFEISAAAAEKFATMIKRPDKEDNIHIEPLANGPEGAVASSRTAPEDRDYSSKRPRKPSFRSDGDRPDFKDKGAYKEKSWKDKPKSDKPYQGDKPRYEGKPRFDDKPKYEGKPKFDGKPKYDPVRADKPAYAKPRSEDTRYEGKPKFEKKPRGKPPTSPRPSAMAGAKLPSLRSARRKRPATPGKSGSDPARRSALLGASRTMSWCAQSSFGDAAKRPLLG